MVLTVKRECRGGCLAPRLSDLARIVVGPEVHGTHRPLEAQPAGVGMDYVHVRSGGSVQSLGQRSTLEFPVRRVKPGDPETGR